MTQNHATPVHATLLVSIDVLWDAAPGAFVLDEHDGGIVYIAFKCPCGCARVSQLPLNAGAQRSSWTWDNVVDAPTLTPSIRQLNGCKWHGHLAAGRWVPVGDSGR